MVRRRALAAGVETQIGNHSFPATEIATYLKNGDTLENAAAMANHSSTRTTQLYDRRRNDISLAEVERVRICRPWNIKDASIPILPYLSPSWKEKSAKK